MNNKKQILKSVCNEKTMCVLGKVSQNTLGVGSRYMEIGRPNGGYNMRTTYAQ